MLNIAMELYLRHRMSSVTLPSTVAGQAILLAGLCIVALALVGILHRRSATQNRRLSNAIDNM